MDPVPNYRQLATAPGLGAVAALLGGGVGGLLGLRLGLPVALPLLHLTVVGLALGYVDIRVHRLPDALVLPSLLCAVPLVVVVSLAAGDPGGALRATIGMAGTYVTFRVLHALSPAGLGRGDVKLSAWTGLVTAWLSWSALVLGLVVAVAAGGVVALGVLAAGGSRRTAVPFGPMLLAGAVVAALTADQLAGWPLPG